VGREVRFECKTASFEGESARVIDKFNGENFNLWKFKMEMVLASMDLWKIVDGSEEVPPSNSDPKVIKEYKGWRPLQGHMQVDHGLRKTQTHDPS